MHAPATTALRLTGRDALAVLHRISTQSLEGLPPGTARTTLFCDFRGRLLHRATVVHAPDGAVWLLRDDAPGADLAEFVDRGVFREDVAIEDRSAALPVRLVRDDDGAAAFAPDGTPLQVPESAGFALATGAGPAVSALDAIRAGHARHGAEIDEAFTPYEANLAAHVHLAKGCYTGQEALQRLVTYDSVRRALVRLAGTGAPPAPQDVHAAGEPAGRLTRAAADGAGWIALAIVKLAALDAGSTLTLADGRPLAAPERFEVARPLGRG